MIRYIGPNMVWHDAAEIVHVRRGDRAFVMRTTDFHNAFGDPPDMTALAEHLDAGERFDREGHL